MTILLIIGSLVFISFALGAIMSLLNRKGVRENALSASDWIFDLLIGPIDRAAHDVADDLKEARRRRVESDVDSKSGTRD